MRTKNLMTWLAMAALTVPQSAIAAHTPREQAVRIALSNVDLAAARGGSVPTTKIGGPFEYGYLSVWRNIGGTVTCGTPAPGSSRILPPGVSGPFCNPSIPLHSLSDSSVLVVIGGMAANLDNLANPFFRVFVNGVEIPAGELGTDFRFRCDATGTAFSEDQLLTIYDCGATNVAEISTSRFHAGLNTITVAYSFVEAALASGGNDIDTRIIQMN